MKAGHACSACLATAGIQCATVLAINELTQEAMEFGRALLIDADGGQQVIARSSHRVLEMRLTGACALDSDLRITFLTQGLPAQSSQENGTEPLASKPRRSHHPL